MSGLQASPAVAATAQPALGAVQVIFWLALGRLGQLSPPWLTGIGANDWPLPPLVSALSATPSPSWSGSQTSPTPSPSRSLWVGLAMNGQLSQASPKPSPSVSSWVGLGT